MNGFVRILIYGLALIGAFLSTAIVAGVMLYGDQVKGVARAMALTEEEREVLETHRTRPPEDPALVPVRRAASEEELLQRIADDFNEGQIRDLVENLTHRRAALDDRAEWLERQEGEMALARASLQRDQQLLQQRRMEVQTMLGDLETRQARWAALQAAEVQRLAGIDEAERARLAELAVMYAGSKRPWWRDAQPDEIARILLQMEPRAAAKALDNMAKDDESPGLPMVVHREMLTVDLDAPTGDHIQRQAALYQLMKPDQVMPYFADSSVEEVTAVLLAIEDLRRRERLLVSLREAFPQKGRDVENRMLAGAETMAEGGR